MKTRQGFVSNSSSTSFMAGVPKGMTKKEARAFLIKKIGGENISPILYPIVKDIANCIISTKPVNDQEELAKCFYRDSFKEMIEAKGDFEQFVAKFFLKCRKRNLDFYSGFAGDDDASPGEMALCYIKCKINDEDFLFFKDEDSY
jgi:hypothetical protein